MENIVHHVCTELCAMKLSRDLKGSKPVINYDIDCKLKLHYVSEELEKISWDDTTHAIYLKTETDVRRALTKRAL